MIKTTLFLILLLGSVNLLAQQSQTDSIIKKLDAFLRSANAADKFNGTAIIVQKGKVLLNKGYGYKNIGSDDLNDSNSIYQIGSITKSFTAIVVLKLQEQGKLSIQDKLNKFFPGYPNGDKITIQNLLTHTSGIYNYTDDIDENDTSIVCHPVSKDRVLEVFKNKPLAFKPGKYFQYCNSGYFLLGMIIEKVTSLPYETVVRNLIFNPLEMHHSGFDFRNLKNKDKTQGYELLIKDSVKKNYTIDSTVYFSAGAIYSTGNDLYKWANAIANHQLINKSSWKQVFTPYKDNYGYGFWINKTLYGKSYINHGGRLAGYTSDFTYFPDDDITIILLSNMSNSSFSITPVSWWLSAILFNLPYSNWQAPRSNFKVDDTILNKYAGTYISDLYKIKVFISLQNGQLFVESSAKQSTPKSPIFPLTETTFLQKDYNTVSAFVSDDKGSVVKLVSHQFGKNIEFKKIK